MYPADDKRVGGYYYPIYKGWATTVTPIFETASTAICFQISQYKRDLREHNTIKTPVWLDVIGSIDPSDFANIISHKFQSTSLIENSYFDQVRFFQVKRDSYLKSRLVRINSQTFLCCKNTMKDNTDYLSSSSSIYKAGSFCVIEHNMKSISYCFDSTGISQKRDTNNLILTVSSSENILANSDIRCNEYIISKLMKAGKGYKGKHLVVSLGAGSGITEISSKVLIFHILYFRFRCLIWKMVW